MNRFKYVFIGTLLIIDVVLFVVLSGPFPVSFSEHRLTSAWYYPLDTTFQPETIGWIAVLLAAFFILFLTLLGRWMFADMTTWIERQTRGPMDESALPEKQ